MQATHTSGGSMMHDTKDATNDYSASGNSQSGSEARLADVASKAATEVANKAAQSLRTLVDEGRHLASARIDATSKWVGDVTRESPMRTLGVVAVIGVVVGLLIGRR